LLLGCICCFDSYSKRIHTWEHSCPTVQAMFTVSLAIVLGLAIVANLNGLPVIKVSAVFISEDAAALLYIFTNKYNSICRQYSRGNRF
jgi:hypothetical protein